MTKTTNIESDQTREVKPLYSASLSGATLPTRVLLTPWGSVDSSNGDFVVDEESARLTVEAFDEHGTDLPIDYEHQTLGGKYASPTGQAPAAGWIKAIKGEPGVGLLAEIEWTEEATRMLTSKQYRYLSPVAIVRKADRKLVAIHSAALTNKPAIIGMNPIVNRSVIVADVEHGGPLSELCAELGLGVDASPDEVLVAASERLATLNRQAKERFVEDRIRGAMRAGKLVEAQRGWAEALVAREEGLFDEWVRTAPVLVSVGRTALPGGPSGSRQRLHAVEAKAKTEYRANTTLIQLTTEEAYVADALRQADHRNAA